MMADFSENINVSKDEELAKERDNTGERNAIIFFFTLKICVIWCWELVTIAHVS